MKEANFVPFIVPGVWDADMQTFAKPQEISAICIHQPEFSGTWDTQDIKDMNHICTFFKLRKNFDSDDVHDSWTFSVFCKSIFLCSDTSVKVWNGLRTFGWTNKVLESRTPLPKTKYSLAIVSLSHCSHSDNTCLDSRHSHASSLWIRQSDTRVLQTWHNLDSRAIRVNTNCF